MPTKLVTETSVEDDSETSSETSNFTVPSLNDAFKEFVINCIHLFCHTKTFEHLQVCYPSLSTFRNFGSPTKSNFPLTHHKITLADTSRSPWQDH